MELFSKPFDTNSFFVGGAGLFLQYYDIVKPVYLYAVMSLIFGDSHGLPVEIIRNMTLPQLFEWYKQRRAINPLYSLDYMHIIPEEELDKLLDEILTDESIYRVTPLLNISRLLEVYQYQHMIFPIFVYSETESPYIRHDVDRIFAGMPHHYVFGDLTLATKKCRENFTYILSDMELMNSIAEVLHGTYSHILLAEDYRYNYPGGIPKYDLMEMMASHPYIRTGTTQVMDVEVIGSKFSNILTGGER